jgi:hypothetical protein
LPPLIFCGCIKRLLCLILCLEGQEMEHLDIDMYRFEAQKLRECAICGTYGFLLYLAQKSCKKRLSPIYEEFDQR